MLKNKTPKGENMARKLPIIFINKNYESEQIIENIKHERNYYFYGSNNTAFLDKNKPFIVIYTGDTRNFQMIFRDLEKYSKNMMIISTDKLKFTSNMDINSSLTISNNIQEYITDDLNYTVFSIENNTSESKNILNQIKILDKDQNWIPGCFAA
jgi:NAD kinase